MDAKQYAEACPKLAESQHLDPGTGTLILLASCHEKEGKLASSWGEFVEAEAQATQAGRKDRSKVASEGAKRVLPLLPRLTLVVKAEAKVAGLVVTIDGNTIAAATWGVAVPVDPGTHAIAASAPGRVSFHVSTTSVSRESKTVEIGALELEAAPPPTPTAPAPASVAPPPPASTPPPVTPPSSGPSRAPAYVIAGIGVVSLGVGAYFGIKASSDNKSANALCPQKSCSNEDGLSKSDSAGKSANLSNLFVGLGVVGLGVGTFLWVRAGDASSGPSATLFPMLGTDRAGIATSGKF